MSTSYSWEGKGRYGSFRLRMNVWVCRQNCETPWEHVPYLSASAVVIHYEKALYQVYAPLPFNYGFPNIYLCNACSNWSTVKECRSTILQDVADISVSATNASKCKQSVVQCHALWRCKTPSWSVAVVYMSSVLIASYRPVAALSTVVHIVFSSAPLSSLYCPVCRVNTWHRWRRPRQVKRVPVGTTHYTKALLGKCRELVSWDGK